VSEPAATEPIGEMHVALITALARVDAVCRELAIPYWVETGTLLGTIRHGGPIPWDDDVDISMLRADFERFAALAPARLEPEYSVQTPSDDPYIIPDAKVYVNGSHTQSTYSDVHGMPRTAHDGLFVDIFIVDPVSPRALVRKIESKLSWLVRSRPWAAEMARSPVLDRAARTRWVIASHIPGVVVKAVHAFLRFRGRRYDGEFLSVGEFGLYPQWTHPRSSLFPLGTADFAGITVPVPADPHTYLADTYGPTYMTPPPVDQRQGHVSDLRFD
jgi:lipopolysaccharide cholinephosphotransferase